MLFETQDTREWQAELGRLRAAGVQTDWTAVRMETLCGRLVRPTTYRLSRFVPGPGCSW